MTIGVGDQPVPAPTLPESSSAAKKAWLTKGLAEALSASHCPASKTETPEAISASTPATG